MVEFGPLNIQGHLLGESESSGGTAWRKVVSGWILSNKNIKKINSYVSLNERHCPLLTTGGY